MERFGIGNKSLKYHPEGARLITLSKNEPKNTSFAIDYLYAGFIVADFTDDNLKKHLRDSSHVFDLSTEDVDKIPPESCIGIKA